MRRSKLDRIFEKLIAKRRRLKRITKKAVSTEVATTAEIGAEFCTWMINEIKKP